MVDSDICIILTFILIIQFALFIHENDRFVSILENGNAFALISWPSHFISIKGNSVVCQSGSHQTTYLRGIVVTPPRKLQIPRAVSTAGTCQIIRGEDTRRTRPHIYHPLCSHPQARGARNQVVGGKFIYRTGGTSDHASVSPCCSCSPPSMACFFTCCSSSYCLVRHVRLIKWGNFWFYW